MKKLNLNYDDIISMEHLLSAWREFAKGKRKQNDVADFEMHLMRNLFALQSDLKNRSYKHGPYKKFSVFDPKPRNIHKAPVRDRIVHHLICQVLIGYFDKNFIFDSYSCRKKKGTLKAINRFRTFLLKASKNNTQSCYILKCDIRKFFASVNHSLLLGILKRHIEDDDIVTFLAKIIGSFETSGKTAIGLPLGNLTSQLFSNIFLNEFDRYMKEHLKLRYYVRYADDFVILSDNKCFLERLTPLISAFLSQELKLSLHDNKLFLKTWASGTDFLGWNHFPYCRTLRTATKKKMIRNLHKNNNEQTFASYYGLLSYGNTYNLKKKLSLFSYRNI